MRGWRLISRHRLGVLRVGLFVAYVGKFLIATLHNKSIFEIDIRIRHRRKWVPNSSCVINCLCRVK